MTTRYLKPLWFCALALGLAAAVKGCGPTGATSTSVQQAATPQVAAVSGPALPTLQSSNAAGATCLALSTAVGYTDTVQAILAANCATCHAAGATPPDLSSYSAASAAASSSLAAIQAGSMPPKTSPAMSAADQASFAAWVSGGTPQTAGGSGSTASTSSCTSSSPASAAASGTTATASASGSSTSPAAPSPTAAPAPAPSPTPAPSPSPAASGQITYTNTIQSFLATSCVGCHGNGGTAPNLATYAAAKAAAANSLGAITGGTMPLSSSLSGTTAASNFQTWVTSGEPQ